VPPQGRECRKRGIWDMYHGLAECHLHQARTLYAAILSTLRAASAQPVANRPDIPEVLRFQA
jgi:hypothetical protein